MTATTGDGATTRAERAYRRALLAYPRRYRRERGEEIVSTLMDAAEHGARVGAGDGAAPTASAPGTEVLGGRGAHRRELIGLVLGGLRVRGRRWWPALQVAGVLQAAFVAGGGVDTARLSIGSDLGDAASRAGAMRSGSALGDALLGVYGAPLLAVVLLVALARRWTRVAVVVLGAQAALVVAATAAHGVGDLGWRASSLCLMALPVAALALRWAYLPRRTALWVLPIVAGYWWAHTVVVDVVSVSILVTSVVVLNTATTARAGALISVVSAAQIALWGAGWPALAVGGAVAVALASWASLLERLSVRARTQRRREA